MPLPFPIRQRSPIEITGSLTGHLARHHPRRQAHVRSDQRPGADVDPSLTEQCDRRKADHTPVAEGAEAPAATTARTDRAELDRRMPTPIARARRPPASSPLSPNRPGPAAGRHGGARAATVAARRTSPGSEPLASGPWLRSSRRHRDGSRAPNTAAFMCSAASRTRPLQSASFASVRRSLRRRGRGFARRTDFGAMSPQLPSPLEQIAGSRPLVQSEDCLSLNVWTPGCDEARRPVMVWIHGGAFTTGTAATPWYSGTTTARNGDVVVVTANYRLGALGFTHLADLGRRAVGVLGQLRHPRSGRGAHMGTRQRRWFRR